MRRSEFIKLYETQKERVEKEGKGSSKWLLGFVEGFGRQKLTGYQFGALIHLLLVPDSPVPEQKVPEQKFPEPEEEKETISGENSTLSIPGIL